jgi:predicted  nucleic acid-binding Zn-ribbon protein
MLAVLLAPLLATDAHAGRPKVPTFDTRQEERDPDFRRSPPREDLYTLVRHLEDCIGGNGVSPHIPGVDLFMLNLEKQLRKGNDIPRDRILRNADLAREVLRLAYNDLAEAMSPDKLSKARDILREVGDALNQVQERNRASISHLRSVAQTARATASAMQISPPDSTGRPVPIEQLSDIQSLDPELSPLRPDIRKAAEKIAKAKGHVLRAKGRIATVEDLAQTAATLDKEALGRLGQRRTRGTPMQYQVQMQSRDVILNANKWLTRAVEGAEDVIRQLEAQLKPAEEGMRKALDKTGEADAKTLDGKEIQTRSGNRINFNHGRRLNIQIEGVIRRGWEAASEKRRPWWEGRARMAKSESTEDASKAEEAHRTADHAARDAEQTLKAAFEALGRIDEELGRSETKPNALAKRDLNVPAPRDPAGKVVKGGNAVKSKPLKIPHTLNVSNQEILQSYDGGDAPPEGDGDADGIREEAD